MDLLYTAHVPAGKGPFPAILALHGWGASAHDLIGLAPALHGGEAVVICPQGPVPVPIAGMRGYGWFPLSEGGGHQPGAFRRGGRLVADFVEGVLESYPIDPRHLAVLGFSQGGVMAYDLVLRDPARFAGLVALSSWLPEELVQGIEPSPEHERLPVLVMHGTRDPMIPAQRARDSRDRLEWIGFSPTYREFEMQHEVSPESLRELVRWLEQKVFSAV